MTTRECVHLVIGSYFRSRDKDGDHAKPSAAAENPMHAQITALCDTRGLIGNGIFNLRRSGFVLARRSSLRQYWMVVDHFSSCDLDLDPTTFKYELDPYCLETHRMCKYELVKAFESYRLTDRQTNRPKFINHAASWVVNIIL